jgi:hypothetical protein
MIEEAELMDWYSIAENFIAGGLVALIFGVFLTWLLSWSNRPKLKIIINLEEPPHERLYWASVLIANHGKKAFQKEEVNWHIYWPHNLMGKIIDKKGRSLEEKDRNFEITGESNIDGLRHTHFTAWIQNGVMPGREICIFRFRFDDDPKPDQIKVRYQFSTILGISPNWAWNQWRLRKIADNNLFPRLQLLPLAEIRDIRGTEYTGSSYIPPEDLSGVKF